MPETLEPRVRDILRNYVREVKSLPNEAAKRSRFAALIAELFPGTDAVTEYSRGVEKLIRIRRETKEKKGYADAYYGNAIIEFEKSLALTLAEAESQLREYVAGAWQKDKARRSLLAIASDGINWKIYRPVLPAGKEPAPETVILDELRPFKLAEESLGAFWLWLTSLLFRPQQVEPTAERFQLDFGTWSPLYRDGMAALKRAWAKVNGGSEAKLAFETWQRYLTVTYGRLTEDTTGARDTETAQEISELEGFFLRHTYLASIARLLIWAALSQGKGNGDLRSVANDVLSGRYFHSKRLANLVDDDFFHWIRGSEAERILAPTWERILSHLTEYELSSVREDVLKGVYQQLLLAKRDTSPGSPKDKLPVLEWEGTLPGRDVNWDIAKEHLVAKEAEGRVIYLGSRAALSTARGATAPSKPSKYFDVFKEGATIVPRSLYFVRITDLDGEVDPKRDYWAETDPEQAREAKPPYDKVHQSGLVEGRFIYSSAVAKNLLPFVLLEPVPVVLPIVTDHSGIAVRDSDALRREGFREFAKWMKTGEEIWKQKREIKAEKQDLYQRLDYHKELSSQSLNHRHLVLFNKSGTNVSAAVFDRNSHHIQFIVDYTLYWASFSDQAEADYVAAILNSSVANLAIKPFQSTGLLGERDVTKKLLELPIPTFDHADLKHRKTAELGAQAREEAEKAIKSEEFPALSSTARQRGFMRERVKAELEEIDKVVAALLG